MEVQFSVATPVAAQTATAVVAPTSGGTSGTYDAWRMSYEPLPTTIGDAAVQAFYGSFTFQDRKGNKWIYRGPHNEGESPSMVMRFYYKTLPGFFFPTRTLADQPPAGTITPYLRATNASGAFVGDAIYGNANNDQFEDGNALNIVYHPVWPENAPVLQMAETLTMPKRGLPQVRGQSSLEVLYQQSHLVGGLTRRSATLHDPTREKTIRLSANALVAIPSSVATESLNGKTYFPNLPPHLVQRFFFDPSRGTLGELALKGEFVDAALGDKYLMLNVLGQQDMAALKALCSPGDGKTQWDSAIENLTTSMETFIENPAQPGTYIPGSATTVGATEIAEVTNDDVAVDSYALTAVGPGTGYLTMIAGNGRAFTPEADPVSLHVVRVVDTLYRGEVNVVEASNPLNEKLTLQQVVDLAGRAEDYNFEWRIAAPVDGFPALVYQNTPVTLVGNGTWDHVRFPLASDSVATIHNTPAARVIADTTTTVAPVSRINFTAVTNGLGGDTGLHFATATPHILVTGNQLVIRSGEGAEVFATVRADTTSSDVVVNVDAGQSLTIAPGQIVELHERVVTNARQSILYREFVEPAAALYSQFWLSMDLDSALGAKVYIDGQLAVTANRGAEDTIATAAPSGLSPLTRVYRLNPALLAGGSTAEGGTKTHRLEVELFSVAQPGAFVPFNLRLEAFASVDVTATAQSQWIPLDAERFADGIRAIIGGAADVRSLSDNYLIMRYQPKFSTHASYRDDGNAGNAVWSQWTSPALAEGWIKRVLKGINPFNQRISDLFNNAVNTDVSIVAQAGGRWEGDIALNLDNINQVGLIEIYETVLNRGRMLSINGGINYGPANDALLLAAGYLNDLYQMLGNEAYADAANPTIGIGTQDNTYGEIATSLFSFKGQLPTVLEEELALLPGVELRPVYNRLVWNYTRGINAGEIIYALNYNIQGEDGNGVIDADDARRMYPQGHGDAYGHYLTAMKGYYSLLLNPNFDWVPRIEAVTVLAKAVSVDYLDERKFAAAASAVARNGKQIFDLTWRRDFKSGPGNGWSHFAQTRANTTTRNVPTTRYWGLDHWAVRTGQGAYVNWIMGNAILPDHDLDPAHHGSIQQVDRTTVPELQELAATGQSLQTAMDNAEAGTTPTGLPENAIPFDLNPLSIANGNNATHFEQIFERAKNALNNAVIAFDDAKDVTRLMRSEQDSLSAFRSAVSKQELAYTNSLIELFGSPYPEDIGPGKTYRTGFAGPDTIHYMYVDTKEISFRGLLSPAADVTWRIDTQTFPPDWLNQDGISDFSFVQQARPAPVDGIWEPSPEYVNNTNLYVEYTLASHGFFKKPATWTGRRVSPGKIQQAASDIIKARNAAYEAFSKADGAKYELDWAIQAFDRKKKSHETIREIQTGIVTTDQITETAKLAYDIADKYLEQSKEQISALAETVSESLPTSLIAGVAAGGDLTAPARGAIQAAGLTFKSVAAWGQVIAFSAVRALEYANETSKRFLEFDRIQAEEWNQELRDATSELRDKVYGMNGFMTEINGKLQELDDAQRAYQVLLAEGDRVQMERQISRRRSATVIQGYRTRDAAFRVFRNEKLERYKTLFDLASQYSFMAAQAYDYDTGLLGKPQGREFINRMIRARALGVVHEGQPQFAGSNTGDPGLSSALAEMYADWQVVKTRLGFNNPDAYGTTVSLRSENFRILPGTNGNEAWKDILNQARKANILDDADVRRQCMQIDPGDGLPVPGLIIEFSTTIADGYNLFGRPLAAYDHAFSSTHFATKIFAVGVALEGYVGMDDPNANGSAVNGSSPPDPSLAFLDPDAMSATPYVYLIPCGVDSMRSPPLGDASTVRVWNVNDVAIPLPFNLGGSAFSENQYWQSSDSLSEPLFTVRKHQAFRPVSSSAAFGGAVVYWENGELARSQYTNTRLIGRSVWNSKWKIVIPGKTLLNDPNNGIERLIRSVNDVKLYYQTYSYSGN